MHEIGRETEQQSNENVKADEKKSAKMKAG